MDKPNKKRNPVARQLRHWIQRIKKNKRRYDRKTMSNPSRLSSQDNE